jgi:hypothetical protein
VTLHRHSKPAPWSAPDDPHLRLHRFYEVGPDAVERWVWEPTEGAWRYVRTFSPSALERLVGEPTEADIERGRQLAEEYGW